MKITNIEGNHVETTDSCIVCKVKIDDNKNIIERKEWDIEIAFCNSCIKKMYNATIQ